MTQIIRRALVALLLIAGTTPVIAQTFPTVPDRSVIGRIGAGGQSGPSSAIPFTTLAAQLGVSNTIPVFSVAAYGSFANALAAARTAKGGIIYFPCGTYNLPSTAKGMDLDDIDFPLRISGPGNSFGGPANKCLQIFYSGSGTAISARSTRALQIDHIQIYSSVCGTKVVDLSWSLTGSDSIQPKIHDNTFQNLCTSASNIVIDLSDTEGATVERNWISANGGIGIRGVAPGRNFSVKATIDGNHFGDGTAIAVSAPGQNWTISNNTAQAPSTSFMGPGPVNTCTVANVLYNWIGDYFSGGVTIIDSNCWSLVSQGNEYANGTGGTNILQTNSTGTVTSIGDRHDGATGVNIGTGNNAILQSPMANSTVSAFLSGTPTTNAIEYIYGSSTVTGTLSLGISGTAAGSLRFWNTTGGANSVTIAPPSGGIGLVTATLPSSSTTLVGRDTSDTLQNKTLNTTNIVTLRDDRFTLVDNADATKVAVLDLSVIGTGTTRTWTFPNTNDVFVGLTSAQTLTNKTLTSPTLTTPSLGVATATTINGAAIDNLAWTSYTPTVTPGAGTCTTCSATGRYKQIGKTVFVQVDVAVTTVGTASGTLSASLPGGLSAAAFAFMGTARDYLLSGNIGFAYIAASGSNIEMRQYNNTTYFASGARMAATVTYEVP